MQYLRKPEGRHDYSGLEKAVIEATAAIEAVDAEIDNANRLGVKSALMKARQHLNAAVELAAQVDLGDKGTKALARLYYCRGRAAVALNKVESGSVNIGEAIADFVKSAELKPDAETYLCLGKAYTQAGDQDAAIESFEKATRLDFDCAEAYLLKGLIHQERGEAEDAHEDIYEAICLNPDLYREEFEPIMQAERESEAIWDELLSRPESQEALLAWAEEAREAYRAGKTTPIVFEDE